MHAIRQLVKFDSLLNWIWKTNLEYLHRVQGKVSGGKNYATPTNGFFLDKELLSLVTGMYLIYSNDSKSIVLK